MGNKKTKWRLILTIAAVWQLGIVVLSAGGIFGDIYELLNVPWNATGVLNILGTTAGWVLLELPLIIVVAYILWRKRRGAYETVPGA
jgi:hypothetical protein